MPVRTGLVTFAELEQMPDDAIHRELVNGELIELPPPKRRHSYIAMRILFALEAHCQATEVGACYAEAGFRLARGEDTWLEPDVSLVRTERLGGSLDDYFEGPPDLALEVISPSESAADVEAKTKAYLETGATAVWNVFPKLKRIRVHRHDRTEFTLTMESSLTEPELLPGFLVDLQSLFPE